MRLLQGKYHNETMTSLKSQASSLSKLQQRLALTSTDILEELERKPSYDNLAEKTAEEEVTPPITKSREVCQYSTGTRVSTEDAEPGNEIVIHTGNKVQASTYLGKPGSGTDTPKGLALNT